ncbi:MAG TPA: MMPL family transporter, partial [Trebonia sp.]
MSQENITRDGPLGGIGRACYRHRGATVAAWIVLVAALITLWTRFGAAADNAFTGSDPGQAVLNQHFARQSGDTLTLAIRSAAPVKDPAVTARVDRALTTFGAAPHVTGVASPYTTPGHVSRDGHIAYATVQFDVQGTAIPGSEATALMNDARTASGNGVTFSIGGDVIDQAETPYGGASNGIGVGAAMIVLLVAFGSLLAMGLPVATALFGIGAGLSLIALLGHVFPAPSFSPIVAAMIGLGVGVDYALFIFTRFRDELRTGTSPENATTIAMRTAGTSVLTAGTTVVIGMLGLLVLRQQLLTGVAIAAAATVAMTVLAALTLLPALLAFTGTRLARPTLARRLRRQREPSHAWEKWAAVIQRHRIVAALGATAFILLLAAPALAMKLSMPDESAQARGT